MKNIGIMGGTFDPPHIGHLLMAQCACDKLQLDKVIFVPTGRTYYKKEIQTTPEDRYIMTCRATENNKMFFVSDIETKNVGYSYTFSTLSLIKKDLPEDSRLFFIVGADSLDYMDKWKNPEQIFSVSSIVVIQRKGFSTEMIKKKADFLYKNFKADIIFIEMPAVDISSTQIRNDISSGNSIKYLVSDNVIEYIKEKKLYIGD